MVSVTLSPYVTRALRRILWCQSPYDPMLPERYGGFCGVSHPMRLCYQCAKESSVASVTIFYRSAKEDSVVSVTL